MSKQKISIRVAAAFLVVSPLTAAMATNGYFSHGYGIKAKSMGGASVAVGQDAFAGANNPAAASWAGNRLEVGADIFKPARSAERTGGGFNGQADSGMNTFIIPEFGYNRTIDKNLSFNLSVYGNGGLNTSYPGGQLNCGAGPSTGNLLCGGGRLGVDLIQLVIAPTVAYKLDANHSVGISPLFTYQQFKADGLQAFDNAPGFPPLTGSPGNVTNNGYDRSTGVGVRVGYLGKLSDQVKVGASYSPKTNMKKFEKYSGLFAGQGDFDIPANFSVGMSVQATPDVLLALDYQRIKYSGVASVGNPSSNQAPLGSSNGPGFGWSDIGVVKVGVQWKIDPRLTMMAGFNKGQNPIQSRDVTFNILAPGVVTTHVTLGGTYALSPKTEVTATYMHARNNSVSGSSLFNGLVGPGAGGNERINLKQNSLGVQFGWRY